jgi:uncharacterized protein YegJ (DUF2314 family)
MNKNWFILLLFVAVACKQGADKEGEMVTEKNAAGEDVYSFDNNSTSMEAAMAEANKTWPLFEQNIFAGQPGTDHFGIKMIFKNFGDEEHLWLRSLHKKNGKLHGVLIDAPYKITDIKAGDTFIIKINRISDWVYSENGKMIGGYTLRVIYNNLKSEEEKREYRASYPFTF